MKAINPTQIWNTWVARSPAYIRTANGEDERFWEQHADVYVRNRTTGQHYEQVTQWLLERVQGKSLIEIGPGPGIFTRFLTEHCTQVTAVEPSPANASRLRHDLSGCLNLKVEQKKWEDVAVRPHDLIFSAGTLCMFRTIETALVKMLQHARTNVLLVTMNEKRGILEEIAATLELPAPTPSELSARRFLEVLHSLNLSFSYQHFDETLSYSYPDIDLLLDLWKGHMAIGREHRSDLEAFFIRRNLYSGNRTAIKVPKRFVTYMVEISV